MELTLKNFLSFIISLDQQVVYLLRLFDIVFGRKKAIPKAPTVYLGKRVLDHNLHVDLAECAVSLLLEILCPRMLGELDMLVGISDHVNEIAPTRLVVRYCIQLEVLVFSAVEIPESLRIQKL